jgi:hypothetical protein
MLQTMILEDIQKDIYFAEHSQSVSHSLPSNDPVSNISDLSSSNLGRSALDMSMSGFYVTGPNTLRSTTITNSFKFGATFKNLRMIIKKTPHCYWIIFEYFRLSLLHLHQIKNDFRIQKEYSAWTDIFIKFSEFLIDLNEESMTEIIKMLSPAMVYRFILHIPGYYEMMKLNLLLFLESIGQHNLIENKILYFTLICKFRPEHANNFIETLEPKHYHKCLQIAKQKHNLHAQAYLQFKQGLFKDSFKLYSKM